MLPVSLGWARRDKRHREPRKTDSFSAFEDPSHGPFGLRALGSEDLGLGAFGLWLSV